VLRGKQHRAVGGFRLLRFGSSHVSHQLSLLSAVQLPHVGICRGVLTALGVAKLYS
jgi:hypothetical protein